MSRSSLFVALSLAILPASAGAQENLENGRFALDRVDNGVVRLDTRTGAMSLCQEKDGDLVCRMAADERAAYEEQLERLEKRVASLETRMASNGPNLTPPREPLPSDAEVDRSIGIMERFMRSFFGLVEEFKSKDHEGTPTAQTY